MFLKKITTILATIATEKSLNFAWYQNPTDFQSLLILQQSEKSILIDNRIMLSMSTMCVVFIHLPTPEDW